MNILKTYAVATQQPGTFLVYWTNSPIRPGGVLKVRVLPKMEDPQIAAELAAMQHLLEEKRVIGTNLVGNPNTRLTVSQGAIRKLQRRQSDKVHLAPYAHFLTTRFAGCQLVVGKDNTWFEGFEPESVEELVVTEPRLERVRVTGLGEVSVTQHVLNRLGDRFLSETKPENMARAIWKRLSEITSDPCVSEVLRTGIWNTVKYARHGKHEGRYFLNARRNLVMVITDNPGEGKRLVTAYPANNQFTLIAQAA
jgi:hypothetical protein